MTIQAVFGGAGFMDGQHFTEQEQIKEILDVLTAGGVKKIDVAELYANAEARCGEAGAGERFTFDTKAPGGFIPGTLTAEGVVKSSEQSLEKLKVKKVDIYYIHAPDDKAPFEEWLPGVDKAYKAGHFARFGLSNFKAEDVEKIYNHCKAHNFVLPSVYQGNYSPAARKQETVLFPTLRRLGISFYAYSPLAGGLLTKTKKDMEEGKGRFGDNMGGMYKRLYSKPAIIEALGEWETLSREGGVERAEAAYRWVASNSPLKKEHGDAIIVGASSKEQLQKTLKWLEKGPLDDKTVAAIDKVWELIEHEAPLDNYHS